MLVLGKDLTFGRVDQVEKGEGPKILWEQSRKSVIKDGNVRAVENIIIYDLTSLHLKT